MKPLGTANTANEGSGLEMAAARAAASRTTPPVVSPLDFFPPEPASDDGAELTHDIHVFLRRRLGLPDDASDIDSYATVAGALHYSRTLTAAVEIIRTWGWARVDGGGRGYRIPESDPDIRESVLSQRLPVKPLSRLA